jgi:mannosyltransferase OCH1-like enzyme
MIPRIVHQTWKTTTLPPQYVDAAASWQRMHPGWTYRLWTHEALEAFAREHYPHVWPLWQRYPDQIQRIDAARYMFLLHFGGVYSDLDVECLRAVEPRCAQHQAVLPRTAPVGVSNDLMMTVPGDPLFAQLVAGLADAQARWGRWWVPRHFRVMLAAGPLHLRRRGVRRTTRVRRRPERGKDPRFLDGFTRSTRRARSTASPARRREPARCHPER